MASGISGASRRSISSSTGVIRAGIGLSSSLAIARLRTPTAVLRGGIEEWPPVCSTVR